MIPRFKKRISTFPTDAKLAKKVIDNCAKIDDSAFSKEPISIVIKNYVNSRVPILVAGGITTPAMANQVLDYGVFYVGNRENFDS